MAVTSIFVLLATGNVLGAWGQLVLPEFLNASALGALPQDLLAVPGSPEAPSPRVVMGPHTFCGGGPEKQYSGVLPAGPSASYFFWLVRSAKEGAHDGKSIPLILWLTGGPGCSSTMAMLYENGPCRVLGKDGAGGWRTRSDPNSWSKVGHVLWVDQPTGVGFSTGQAQVWDESEVGSHMLAFLENFFAEFPDLVDVPFFVTGESYAGHYVPAVAHAIIRNQARSRIRVTGIAMGNALVNPWPQIVSQIEMAGTGGGYAGGSLDHGIVDDHTYNNMKAVLPQLKEMVDECQRQPSQDVCVRAFMLMAMEIIQPARESGLNLYDLTQTCSPAMQPLCLDLTDMKEFLNDETVKRKLGAPSQKKWDVCSPSVLLPFVYSGDWMSRLDGNVVDILESGARVLVYAGDVDYMVNWMGCKAWVKELAWPHQKQWSQMPDSGFYVSGHKRGMQRTYANLTFIQVYEAGHMVPIAQPEASLAMIQRFVESDLHPVRSGKRSQDHLVGHPPMVSWVNSRITAGTAAVAAIALLLLGAARCLKPQRRNRLSTTLLDH